MDECWRDALRRVQGLIGLVLRKNVTKARRPKERRAPARRLNKNRRLSSLRQGYGLPRKSPLLDASRVDSPREQFVFRSRNSRLFIDRSLLRGGLGGAVFLWLAFEQRNLLQPRRVGRTPGCDLGIILKRVVDDATFIGIHWLELK